MASITPSAHTHTAESRPVFTREQALTLAKQILALTTVEHAVVMISQTVRSITQLANGRVRSHDEGDSLDMLLGCSSGQQNSVTIQANQIDDASLRGFVAQTDAVLKGMLGNDEKIFPEPWDEQDPYPRSTIWHDTTANAMTTARETSVPQILDTVHRYGLEASGFVGLIAKAHTVLTDKGITAYADETDCEISVTARLRDGTASGWSGKAARDWADIDPAHVAIEAAEMATHAQNPVAIEPGHRIAILGPAAVVQLMRFLVPHFDGYDSDDGATGFSKVPGWRKGNKIGRRVFDPRVTITTDPTDPDGGSPVWFGRGAVDNPTTWIDRGVLKYLGYGVNSLRNGRAYAMMPYALRFHGGETPLEEMIAQCDDGIYVHRIGRIDVLDMQTGLMTGVTCDGCFHVKQGKIDRPIKNFRFQTSPFFFLNNVMAIGPTRRTAFGYAPWTNQEEKPATRAGGLEILEWPRRPMIVPPLMVRDFNFNTIIDAI